MAKIPPIFLHLNLCGSGLGWQREAFTLYLCGYPGLQTSSSACPTAPSSPSLSPSGLSSPVLVSCPLVGSSLHSDYGSRIPGPGPEDFMVIIKKEKLQPICLGFRSVFPFFPLLCDQGCLCLRISSRSVPPGTYPVGGLGASLMGVWITLGSRNGFVWALKTCRSLTKRRRQVCKAERPGRACSALQTAQNLSAGARWG